MYGKSSWGGPVDPYIEIVFPNDTVKEDTKPVVSLLIFEWKDLNLVGLDDPNRPGDVRYTHPLSLLFSSPRGHTEWRLTRSS